MSPAKRQSTQLATADHDNPLYYLENMETVLGWVQSHHGDLLTAEELDRLDAHIEETRAALKTDKPIGRRLDFLMQEFNREANTLASKSGDPATSTIAVDLKVLIEQMREQVQNVE